MSLPNRLHSLIQDPTRTWLNLVGRYRREALFARYHRLSQRAGLDRLYLVLSFDCDTPQDMLAAPALHQKLAALGLKPVYAIPGELLVQHADTARWLLAQGAEFINHGHTQHTFVDEKTGQWASCFFYDQLPLERVRQDVEEGDATLRRVLGVTPQGFRIPHFGTFQQPGKLRFLHGVLKNLGYRFSTSTLPKYGFLKGPAFKDWGLWELPVSGQFTVPLALLDSWSCFAAPDRAFTPQDYVREGRAMAGAFAQNGWCGVLNYYADPCHVAQSQEFLATVTAWAQVAKSVTYGELMGVLENPSDH